MVGVTGLTIADNFGINVCATALGHFQFLQDKHARALRDDKAVTIDIKWPRCRLRVIISC